MAPQNEERAARLRAQANDPSFENVWQELRWRGLVHVSTDEAALEQALAGEPVSYYCGFDPTAPSLHLGHLVQLLTLRRLTAQAGDVHVAVKSHKPRRHLPITALIQ